MDTWDSLVLMQQTMYSQQLDWFTQSYLTSALCGSLKGTKYSFVLSEMRVRLFPISSPQFSWFVFELFNSRDDGSCSNGSCSSCSSNCTSVAWERYINIKLMFSIRMLHKYRDTMWHLISECYHHVVFSARIICV